MTYNYFLTLKEYRPPSRQPGTSAIVAAFRQASTAHHGCLKSLPPRKVSSRQSSEDDRSNPLAKLVPPPSFALPNASETLITLSNATPPASKKLLERVELRILQELHILSNRELPMTENFTAGQLTPASRPLSRTSCGIGVVERDRLRIFQEAGRQVTDHFDTYAPLLSRILAEYDSFIHTVVDQQLFPLLNDLQQEVARKSFAHDKNEIPKPSEHASDPPSQLPDDARKDAQPTASSGTDVAAMSKNELRSYFRDLMCQLGAERQKVFDLTTKLETVQNLKGDFQNAVRSVEETIRMIEDERDLEISKVRHDSKLKQNVMERELDRLARDNKELQKLIDEQEIATQLLRQREALLLARCQNLETQSERLIVQGNLQKTELRLFEKRLQEFDPSGTLKAPPVDPVMTPRPSKSDAALRIPGFDPSQYPSTISMLEGIYGRFDIMYQKDQNAETIFRELDDAVQKKFAERNKKVIFTKATQAP